ncbi:MAG: TPM domain-containing protein [Chloroflexota bacterium]
MHRPVALAMVIAWLGVLLLAVLTLAAGPPFPSPTPGQRIHDTAGVLSAATVTNAEQIAGSIAVSSGAEVVVYTQRLASDDAPSAVGATSHARDLREAWSVGGAAGLGMVILADLRPDGSLGHVGISTGDGLERLVSLVDLTRIRTAMDVWLDQGDLDTAVIVGLAEVYGEALSGPALPAGPPSLPRAPPPGPPFPDPVDGQAVYDFAGVFSEATIAQAESMIDVIESRTSAELAVYTQVVDYGVTTEESERRARALIDQWGIGRAGFDDGMVVFFDLDPSLEHGQVQLYAAPGFEATYLTNSERQAIFENDMVPYLRVADLDQALLVALQRIDRAATPENAARLQAGRQVDAVLGLVLAPVVFMSLAGWAFMSWRRYGKDPVYLDSPSILMPAPPPDLTAASGAFVMDGGTSRRALTTALLDLASRGQISFREEKGLLGLSTKVGIDTAPPPGDAVEEAQRARNARRPTGPAEAVALQRLRAIDGSGSYIEPDDLPKFGTSVPKFDAALEGHVVKRGWMVEKPSKVIGRWVSRGIVAIVAGVVAIVIGANVPMSGLVLIGVAAIGGGIVVLLFAQGMPSVTMPGAMIRAMLAAYRRTLKKTMEQARSMQQVVDDAGLEWLETPDQALVWGTALGLQGEIEDVLKRSLEDVERGAAAATTTYFPGWYRTSSGQSFASASSSGSGGSIFSGSAIPNIGGMMSALGTIGNAPSSSGSGGGGGFSGGSSGGGGGGAGGGF